MIEFEHDNAAPPLETKYFRLRYWWRNPPTGRGSGVHGVWDINLVKTYAAGLDQLYEALIAPPWSRPPLQQRVNVYVLDPAALFAGAVGAFSGLDTRGAPYIVLPSRSHETTAAAETARALAQAVHEATHVFNWQHQPLHHPQAGRWEWFDEATAVLAERRVLAEQASSFRWLNDWIVKPETPLDHFSAQYSASQFALYLAQRFGLAFINRVWLESKPGETPLETMARLLPASETLFSANPAVPDVFASGYCLDAWFLNDPASLLYAPELYARAGERALTESFALRAEQTAATSGRLDHLACRYYRFSLAAEVRELQLDFVPAEAEAQFKAELASVTKAKRRGAVTPLRPLAAGQPGLTVQLEPDEADHYILVVTNCGTRTAQTHAAQPHDDQQQYTLKVTTR